MIQTALVDVEQQQLSNDNKMLKVQDSANIRCRTEQQAAKIMGCTGVDSPCAQGDLDIRDNNKQMDAGTPVSPLSLKSSSKIYTADISDVESVEDWPAEPAQAVEPAESPCCTETCASGLSRDTVSKCVTIIKSKLASMNDDNVLTKEGPLGSGGFGDVYVSYVHVDEAISRVAYKVPKEGTGVRGLSDLTLEAMRGALLPTSPYINAPTACVWEEKEGSMYVSGLVSPLVVGLDFHHFLVKFGETLPPSTHMKVVLQLAGGLVHLHRAGYLHLDLKPGNAMVPCDHETGAVTGNAQWIDFGLSASVGCAYDSGAPVHPRCGTPEYTAPEVVFPAPGSRMSVATRASDVFSFAYVMEDVVDCCPALAPWLLPLRDVCSMADPRARPSMELVLLQLGAAMQAVMVEEAEGGLVAKPVVKAAAEVETEEEVEKEMEYDATCSSSSIRPGTQSADPTPTSPTALAAVKTSPAPSPSACSGSDADPASTTTATMTATMTMPAKEDAPKPLATHTKHSLAILTAGCDAPSPSCPPLVTPWWCWCEAKAAALHPPAQAPPQAPACAPWWQRVVVASCLAILSPSSL